MKLLSPEVRAVLNDETLIARRDLWFRRMSCLFDGAQDDYNDEFVYTLAGGVPREWDPADAFARSEPEKWVADCLNRIAQAPEIAGNRFAPLCVEYPIYGVHFIDKIFGADVFWKDNQWSAHYLTTPIGQLQMPDLEKDETWALARRAALAFVEEDVRLPLFGMPTLSSALNIFINLYGGEALEAMLLDEEAAQHDLNVINDLIRTLHRWYLANVPLEQLQAVVSWARTQPAGYGQLCGCSTQLLSGELYAKMVAPLDDALLGEWPHGGMIHFCGAHTQHMETFRSMKHLRALQLNDRAACDLKQYYDGLRDDQILYLNPCGGMPVEEAVSITGGNRMVLVSWQDAPAKPKA